MPQLSPSPYSNASIEYRPRYTAVFHLMRERCPDVTSLDSADKFPFHVPHRVIFYHKLTTPTELSQARMAALLPFSIASMSLQNRGEVVSLGGSGMLDCGDFVMQCNQ